MGSSPIVATLQLSRVPSTLVAFLTVFLPTYVHTRELAQSIVVAIPMITISMCTYILNDLHDLDRDRINHPNRPLPSGRITTRGAAVVYTAAFAISIALIRIFTNTSLHFVYLTLFLLAINYNTIVEYLPKLKTIYVAATATLPIILVTQILGTPVDWALWTATFLFITGREILMDVEDSKGDGDTIAKWLSPKAGTWLGFSLPVLGAVVLIPAIHTALELGAYLVIVAIFPVVALSWRSAKRRPLLLEIMKIQMLMGIVFLL